MKRSIFVTIFAIFTLVCSGQTNGAITFLGIPIDGSKSQFVSRLKEKGFEYNSYTKTYQGQFNGKDVDVIVHTNHKVVDRVYVAFPATTELGAIREFNTLLRQFNKVDKYMDLSMNTEIPYSERLSNDDKHYVASFTYFDPNRDQNEFVDALLDSVSDFMTPEQLAAAKATMALPDKEREERIAEIMAELQQSFSVPGAVDSNIEEKAMQFFMAFMNGIKSLADGEVWFTIHEVYGQYNIGLYYDNLHNQAHGEDL